MRLLLTGATGFIGIPLVRTLLSRGYRCCVLTHRPPRARRLLPEEAHVLTYHDSWPEVDAVVNLAGESVVGLWTGEKRQRILQSRTQTTHRLVEWIRVKEPRPALLISMSAVGIYGHRPGDLLTEEAKPDPQDKFRAVVTRSWEATARPARELGLRVVILRMANVLHPEGGYLGRLLSIYRYLPFVFGLGDEDNYFPWLSRRDALRTLIFALERDDAQGILNVAAPQSVDQGMFTSLLAQHLGKPAIGRVPDWLMEITLGEFSSALIDSQQVIPARLGQLGFHFEDTKLGEYLGQVL